MKIGTKNKVLAVLTDHLYAARRKKADALSKIYSCQENIRWAKRDIPKNSQALVEVQKLAKTLPKLEYSMVEVVKKTIKQNHDGLKRDREALKKIQYDLSSAKSEIRKWNDLINEVSPYKK